MTENDQTQQTGQTGTTETGQPGQTGSQTGYDAGYQAGYQAARQAPPPRAQAPYSPPTYRRLTRSRPESSAGAPISGVCGGIAQYLGMDPTLVRVLVAVAMVVAFPVAEIIYIVLWAVVPQE